MAFAFRKRVLYKAWLLSNNWRHRKNMAACFGKLNNEVGNILNVPMYMKFTKKGNTNYFFHIFLLNCTKCNTYLIQTVRFCTGS